ncbi:MAG: methyltransferase domain-containing protein [Kiritimatiellia bacterium]
MPDTDRDSRATARRFARNFRTYSAEAQVQRQVAELLVSALAELVPDRRWDRVVELGCGTGLLTRAWLRRFSCRSLQLFDLADNCPEFLADVARCSFTCADLDELQRLPPAELVLSSSCLQWLQDPVRLFRVVRSALPRGGLFAASAFSAGNLGELGACGGRPLPCPPADVWRGWLEECGYAVRRFESWAETLRFASPLAALRHLKRTGVLIPANDGYREVRRFLDRYEALRTGGTIPLTYRPVLWIAEKQ